MKTFKNLIEAKAGKVVVSFGRMNPMTNGHEKLANKLKSVAQSEGATARLYLSHSTNPKKDPLDFAIKVRFAKKAFGNIVQNSAARTIIEVFHELDGKFSDVIVVVGSDRIQEFETLLNKYNGKNYNFNSIEVISAGERDPDAEGVEGMSGSKMRKFASENDFENFKKGVPSKLSDNDAKKLFDEVRKGMNINENFLKEFSSEQQEELDESVLSLSGRRKRAMQLRRMKAKIAVARQRAMRRFASPEKLNVRARRMAINFLKKRYSSGKGYSQMSPGQKIEIDKKIQKLMPVVGKIASRLLPQVRRAEVQRKASQRAATKESVETNINEQFELFLEAPKLPQDKHVGDKEGTQPAKYYKGLEKSTKERRDAHFKAHSEKSDSDPSSYVDAPGDIEAREKGMPQSKHTKKYKQMFGEAIDKQELAKLNQLIRLGLADKKLLSVIQRAISKIDAGDALNPNERQATQSLLMTLVDIVTTGNVFMAAKGQIPKLSEDFAYENEEDGEEEGEEPDWEETESDGLYMAKIEISNLIDDAEDVLMRLDSMEEEPEAWITSKITLAVDYMATVRDYLEFHHLGDSEEYYEIDDEDDDEEFAGIDVYECIKSMGKEELGELYEEFTDMFEEVEGLKKKAEKSGISYGILKQVYDRGMAAWKGGHRPGTTPQQWAFARVNSFITKGKGTWGGADSDLAAKVKGSKETNEEFENFTEALEWGTDELRKAYATATPGQSEDIIMAKYSANSALQAMNSANVQRLYKLYSEDIVKEMDRCLTEGIYLFDNNYRLGSEKFFEFFRAVRESGVELTGMNKSLIEETDIGEIVEYEGEFVPLDCPMVDEGIAATLGSMVFSSEYKDALKALKELIARKKTSGKMAHDKLYYAARVAQSYKHVDAKKLASMMEEVESIDEELKLWKFNPTTGLWRVERTVSPETQEKWLEIFKKDDPKGKYIVSKNKPGAKAHLKEEDEKDPPLNQPKRGGPKKFYVYVRDPSSGNIKKVTWGDTTGLSVKMNDPEARKSFAARHQCSTQKDRTSAAYWACNTPRYAKQLGLSGGGNFYW